MKNIKWLQLILAIGISQTAGLIGSIFTVQAIPTWYINLNKPWFNPPNWIFGPVWFALYTLMGMALYLIRRKDSKNPLFKQVIIIFCLQLIFNASWSIVFFGLRNIQLALINIIILWCLVVETFFSFYKIDKIASYMLIPYVLWTSFAGILNYYIWALN